jgi:uncharacterized protein (DUF1778 family)
MPPPDAKPPVKMESRDERVTIRLTPTQRTQLAQAARSEGEELSRYIRRCTFMGHSMNAAQHQLKATGV